jgi:tetratricopeptide (TPR) repeat protein
VPKFGRTQWICLALFLVTLALFWPLTTYQFVNFDDPEYVYENPYVSKGLTLASLSWAFRASYASNWHPLTWIAHSINCDIFGLEPGGHHLINVLFHAANAVILFLLLGRMTTAIPTSPLPSPPAERGNVARGSASDATWRSALVAALFAWHPLHVESVAWISELKDVLSTFFFFLTLWSYARYVETSGARVPYSVFRVPGSEVQGSVGQSGSDFKVGCSMFDVRCSMFWYCSALFLFALGLMSKPMLVTTPFVLLLLDYWPLGRLQLDTENWKLNTGLLLEKVPFLVLAALDCRMTIWAQRTDAMASLASLPMGSRVANALVSYVLYLGKTVWPQNLAVLYPWSHDWTLWAASGAVVSLLAISAMVLWQMRRRRYLAVGWFWFLGTLVPVIGFVQVGMQSMADRYTYIPLVGIFIMVVWGGAEYVESTVHSPKSEVRRPPDGIRNTEHFLFGSAAAVLVTLMICTHEQLRYWRDSVTLWSRAIRVTPDNLRAEYNLGNALANPQGAIPHYLRAVQIKPSRVEARADIHRLAHQNLGVLFARLANWPAAEEHFRAALAEKPDDWEARGNLAGCLEVEGRFEEAIKEFRMALQGAADSPDIWRRLANSLLRTGRSNEAEEAYRQAVKLNPSGVLELNDLAWFLATDPHPEIRNGPEAVSLAQRACELTAWSEPRCLGTLDAAYAEVGRFEEAIAMAQQAQKMALERGQNGLAEMAGERLELYRAGKPYRQQ